MSENPHDTAPTVFGVPMQPEAGPSWHIENEVFSASVYSHNGVDEWSGQIHLKRLTIGSGPRVGSAHEAARAIEHRLRDLVLALVPMLDSDTRREVSRLCGIERVPSWHKPSDDACTLAEAAAGLGEYFDRGESKGSP